MVFKSSLRAQERRARPQVSVLRCLATFQTVSEQCSVVIFLHGLACTSAAFDPLFADKTLTSNLFMVSEVGLLFCQLNGNSLDVQIRYDTRGHGRTGGPDNAEGYVSKRMSPYFPLRGTEGTFLQFMPTILLPLLRPMG